MEGQSEWIPPSQRTPEGKAAFERALAEVRRHGEASEWEQEQELIRQETERLRQQWMDVKPIPEAECVQEVRFEPASCGVKHYGLWNDEKGWWWCYMKVYATTSKTLAQAQLDAFNRDGMGWGKPKETYRVRCIEEWADEQQNEAS